MLEDKIPSTNVLPNEPHRLRSNHFKLPPPPTGEVSSVRGALAFEKTYNTNTLSMLFSIPVTRSPTHRAPRDTRVDPGYTEVRVRLLI